MALGAFAAIGQTNIKRLMAYSSIGHMGFALVGLAAGTRGGVQGVLIYMAIYIVMTLGTFAAHPVDAARRQARWNRSPISPGLARTNAPMAFFLADADVVARRRAAARRLLRQMVRVRRGDARPISIGLAVIGVLLSAVGRLLLLAHRQDDVFRRAGPAFDQPSMTLRARAGGFDRGRHAALLRLSGAADRRGAGRGQVAVLNA